MEAQRVRVTLPHHLQKLARVAPEVEIEVAAPVSVATVLDALEASYPVLKGTIRDHVTHNRRPFLRFFAAGEDISLEPPGHALPDSIAAGREPLMVVGAIAGG
ncbi:MAG TPA: MoaD/ThiS family protein [Fimbriimonadaceae bacterium]|nr:MoaD/ThiS family protein [Fimbriimonadaceae bacterium]